MNMIRNTACQSATGNLKHTFPSCLRKWHMPRHSVMIRFEAWCKMRHFMIFHICLIRNDARTNMLHVFTTKFDWMERPRSLQWWLHDIYTFSILLAICESNVHQLILLKACHRAGALVFSFLSAWKTYWSNGWVGGDFRRHNTHTTSLWCERDMVYT